MKFRTFQNQTRETNHWNEGLGHFSSAWREETQLDTNLIDQYTIKGTFRFFLEDSTQEDLKTITDLQAQVAAGCHSHPEDDPRFWWR